MSPSRRILSRVLVFASFLPILSVAVFAGGTPDPGMLPLTVDSGDADALPDNENQLLGQLGANRTLATGDYVTDGATGLQRSPAEADRDGFYRFGIEVPPGQSSLVVEIFDADIGASSPDATGIDLHDQNNEGSWETRVTYELLDPDGVSVASITLPPRDCDPSTAVILESGCDNSWTAFPGFSVASPDPGHWTFRTRLIEEAGTQNDNNSYGLRAHDGDPTAAGTEFPVYAQSYIGLGHVYGTVASPANFSRTHDLFPYLTRDCSCDLNDFDLDDSGDESATFTPPRMPAAPFAYDFFSTFTNWNTNVASGFTTDENATNYGLWNLRWIVGRFNFYTFYMGSEATVDPMNPAGGGNPPDVNPIPDAIRLYLPADGSRFFGERGGPDDVIVAPEKPWVGQSFTVISGSDPFVGGITSRVQVTITIDNPTAFPIQFDAATTDPDVVTARVPTNGGQTMYVTGSAAINNSSAAAGSGIAVSGTGPWDLTFAPGVVDAGDTATLTYEIDVTPTGAGLLDLTGSGATGTAASYLDETCANGAGGASTCSATAITGSPDLPGGATQSFGPLCPLRGTAGGTAVIGVAKRVTSGPTSNGDGTFTVGLEFVVENLGSENLSNVQVTDDLTATFPAPATLTAVGPPVATGTLTANAGYNGNGDQNLLVAGSSTLASGASATITLSVTFDPNGLPGPFFNQATATGSPPSGGTTTDPSDNGADPDPNGNDNPNEAGENDPTPIPITENPSILTTKSASAPSQVAGDVYDVIFTVVVQNTGDVDLTIASVVDDLTATFTAPASLVGVQAGPSVMNAGGATLAANGGYDGDGDTNLVTVGGSLPVAASSTITVTVRFDTGGTTGPFVNTAAANGTSPQSANVQDSDTASVTVSLVESPAIQITKSLSTVTPAAGTSSDVVFLLVVENTGNVDLSNLQVTDLVTAAFPGATVGSASATCNAGSCGTVTVQYSGPADATLLDAAASSLPVGQSVTLRLEANVTPAGNFGPFTNTATATGESPTGTPVQDTDSAQVSLPVATGPVIGLAKAVTAGPTDNGDDTFTVTLRFVVENLGGEDLTNVQVADDLAATFPAPANVVSVTAPVAMITGGTGTLVANAGYDGTVDTDLLVAGSSSLDVGAAGQIVFDVTFDPGSLDAFENTATATADGATGTTTDVSDDGAVTDADNDGEPNEPGENDPTPIVLSTVIDIPMVDPRGLLALAVLLAGVGLFVLRRVG